mgnify:CR=1 FL=1
MKVQKDQIYFLNLLREKKLKFYAFVFVSNVVRNKILVYDQGGRGHVIKNKLVKEEKSCNQYYWFDKGAIELCKLTIENWHHSIPDVKPPKSVKTDKQLVRYVKEHFFSD